MLSTEVSMAVFFTQESQEIRDIYQAVKSRSSATAKSAAASEYIQIWLFFPFFNSYCCMYTFTVRKFDHYAKKIEL